MGSGGRGTLWGTVPGPVGHLSFNDILDTSLKVSWQEPGEKNGILTGRRDDAPEPKGGTVGDWAYQLIYPLPAPILTSPAKPHSQLLAFPFQSIAHLGLHLQFCWASGF